MAGGLGVTKEPATDPFATRFHDAGFSVLAFDFRHLGESDGEPRQVVYLKRQLADWRAAIEFAAALPEVNPAVLDQYEPAVAAQLGFLRRHLT